MSDCLLIHPLGYNEEKASGDISRMANMMPPLGLASISSYLSADGIDNDIVDCYASPEPTKRILKHHQQYRPEVVGFSCTTSSFFDGISMATLIKEHYPETSIVFGGPHVSALKEAVLVEYPVIDYCVIGEGEETLRRLIAATPSERRDLKGLVVRDEAGLARFNGYRETMIELDSLPLPAYDKLAGYPDAYKLPIFNYPSAPNGSCISSRGCPYACSYCDRSVFRRSFRYNSSDYLYEHFRYLSGTHGLRHINLYDDQFTFQRQRIIDFCRKMIDRPLGLTFNCAARAEHLDEEVLRLMHAAGCWMISLGIETGDQELLAQHRQNPDLAMMREKILLIKEAGIRVKGLLMMGLPGESEQSIKKSRDYTYSLPLDDFNLAKFTPFPGSPIYKKIKAEGQLLGEFDEDWTKMDCMHFQFVPKGLEKEQMERLFQDFYKHHFMRLSTLLAYVAMIWKSPDSWRRFLSHGLSFLRFILTMKRIRP